MSSYGQSILREYLQLAVAHPFLENHRPDWLNGLELDFYFPDLNLGIEFQGDQHFINTKDFGPCRQQQYRDAVKRRICRERGVLLLRFTAIDLQYHRVRSLLKYAFRALNRRKGSFKKGILSPSARRFWKPISEKAIEYRERLCKRYDSPTARKKGKTRHAAMSRHNASYTHPR